MTVKSAVAFLSIMNVAGYWSTNVQFCSGSSTSRRAAEGSPWRLFPCKIRISQIKEHSSSEMLSFWLEPSLWGPLSHELSCDHISNIKWRRTGSRNQQSNGPFNRCHVISTKKTTSTDQFIMPNLVHIQCFIQIHCKLVKTWQALIPGIHMYISL